MTEREMFDATMKKVLSVSKKELAEWAEATRVGSGRSTNRTRALDPSLIVKTKR